MQLETRNILELKAHPRNDEWRKHPPEQLKELGELLTEFGWLRNVVVSSDGFIIAGHGIVQAAKQRGETEVPVVVMAHRHDTPEALKFMVAENTVQRLAVQEDAGLAALLCDLQSTVGLDGTGHDAASLDALVGQLAAEDVTLIPNPDAEATATRQVGLWEERETVVCSFGDYGTAFVQRTTIADVGAWLTDHYGADGAEPSACIIRLMEDLANARLHIGE